MKNFHSSFIIFALLASCDTGPTSAPAPTQPAPTVVQAPPRVSTFKRPSSAKPSTVPTIDTRTPAQLAAAACTDPHGKWRCKSPKPGILAASSETTPIVPASWTVPHWALDGANSTGCASDSNSGTSTTCSAGGIGPLLTCGELQVHRLGGYEWNPQQPTTISVLSNGSTTDLCFFRPNIIQNSALNVQCALTSLGTAALNVVTAKARGTTGALTSTITGAIPGGCVEGTCLVQNTNVGHPSFAWVDANTAGTLTFTQPMVSNTPTLPTLAVGFPAEVDSWTHGDTITFLSASKLYIAEYNAKSVGTDVSADTILAELQNCWVPDPVGIDDSAFNINHSVRVTQSIIDPWTAAHDVDTNIGGVGNVSNSEWRGAGTMQGLDMSGGAVGCNSACISTNIFGSSRLDGDIIIHGGGATVFQSFMNQSSVDTVIGFVNLLGAPVATVWGATTVSNSEYGGHSLYGTYTLDVEEGVFNYTTPASGGTGSFQGSPTLEILGQTTAHSTNTTGHVDTPCGAISLTPAALDTAATATCSTNTGFSGLAFYPGGPSITSLGL